MFTKKFFIIQPNVNIISGKPEVLLNVFLCAWIARAHCEVLKKVFIRFDSLKFDCLNKNPSRCIWATTRQNVSSGVSDQARHKQACAATEASYSLEISAIEYRDIILSKQRTTKALISLRACAGWSAPLLFAYDIKHNPLMTRLINLYVRKFLGVFILNENYWNDFTEITCKWVGSRMPIILKNQSLQLLQKIFFSIPYISTIGFSTYLLDSSCWIYDIGCWI